MYIGPINNLISKGVCKFYDSLGRGLTWLGEKRGDEKLYILGATNCNWKTKNLIKEYYRQAPTIPTNKEEILKLINLRVKFYKDIEKNTEEIANWYSNQPYHKYSIEL